jgi:hypothetical protein
MAKLRKFLSLSPTERRLLLKAAMLLAAVRLGLWLLTFRAQRSLLAILGRVRPVCPTNPASLVHQIVWAVETATPYVPRATCLTQALAAQVLLHRVGVHTDLRLGAVQDRDGKFQAHAWLEQDGRGILGHRREESYTPFGDIPWW